MTGFDKIPVVRTNLKTVGKGEIGDPVRGVVQWWNLDGEIIHEHTTGGDNDHGLPIDSFSCRLNDGNSVTIEIDGESHWMSIGQFISYMKEMEKVRVEIDTA